MSSALSLRQIFLASGESLDTDIESLYNNEVIEEEIEEMSTNQPKKNNQPTDSTDANTSGKSSQKQPIELVDVPEAVVDLGDGSVYQVFDIALPRIVYEAFSQTEETTIAWKEMEHLTKYWADRADELRKKFQLKKKANKNITSEEREEWHIAKDSRDAFTEAVKLIKKTTEEWQAQQRDKAQSSTEGSLDEDDYQMPDFTLEWRRKHRRKHRHACRFHANSATEEGDASSSRRNKNQSRSRDHRQQDGNHSKSHKNYKHKFCGGGGRDPHDSDGSSSDSSSYSSSDSREQDDVNEDLDISEALRRKLNDDSDGDDNRRRPNHREQYKESSQDKFEKTFRKTMTEVASRCNREKLRKNMLHAGKLIKMPDLTKDLELCPPWSRRLKEKRTPGQFLHQYHENIGNYVRNPIAKITRLVRIWNANADTHQMVKLVKEYLKLMEIEDKVPNPDRVDQMFLERYWDYDSQRKIEKLFLDSVLDEKRTHIMVFAEYWYDRLTELTATRFINPIEEITAKCPSKFRGYVRRATNNGKKRISMSNFGSIVDQYYKENSGASFITVEGYLLQHASPD